MRFNRFVFLNRPMLSLEAHLGVTASPQAPFPTDYVTLPVSASHRRFGSLPLAAEKGHTPILQRQLLRVLHSKHAQATSPPYGRATLAGRTVGLVDTPVLADGTLVTEKRLLQHRQQFDRPAHRSMRSPSRCQHSSSPYRDKTPRDPA